MQKRQLEKEEFYPRLISLIEQAQRSVWFYSISCCFGFYSYGIKNFETILNAIREKLNLVIGGKFLDIRVLVSIDPENPIDQYAAQCLAALDKTYEYIGQKNGPRQVFKELQKENLKANEMIQFLIVDDKTFLMTEVQEKYYNQVLNLVLNISQPGFQFDSSTDCSKAERLRCLFDKAWLSAKGLDVRIPKVSLSGLRLVLKGYKGVQRARNERELQLLLTGYLQGRFSPAIIDFEARVDNSRIDLLVGYGRPQHERIAIEIKYKTEDNKIDNIIGQIGRYKSNFSSLFLVVGIPLYSAQAKLRLKIELDRIGVSLIELV